VSYEMKGVKTYLKVLCWNSAVIDDNNVSGVVMLIFGFFTPSFLHCKTEKN
jgi:hypothetical protein